MKETTPQYSPSGGIGSTSSGGGFTYGSGGWTPSNQQFTPAPKPKKPVSVVNNGPAKEEVTKMTNTVNSSNSGGVEEYDKSRSDFENALNNYNNRTLTKAEKRLINNARDTMQQQIENQKLVNKNYEAGVNQMGIRSGRQRYAPEVQGGYQKAAIDQGMAKVSELSNNMEAKIADIEQALLDKNYDRAREYHKDYLDFLGERRKAVKDIADMANDGAKSSAASKYERTVESVKAYNDFLTKNGFTSSAFPYKDFIDKYNPAYDDVMNANQNPQPITQEMADSIGLSSLAGKTDKDVIESLSLEDAPDWFSKALAKEWLGKDYPKSIFKKKVQLAWDSFRNSPSVKPLKDMADELGIGGSSSGGSSGGGEMGSLIDDLE